jgi:DNA-binding IclR family transcriptional regulator
VGDSYPLHCTANGKAYLGEIDDTAIVELIGRKYQRRTKNTKVTFAELAAEMKTVRQTGVAVDIEEHSSGVCATGVALRDPAGNYVAISVPVPSQRFKDEYKMIARRLLETKAALEKQIISRHL